MQVTLEPLQAHGILERTSCTGCRGTIVASSLEATRTQYDSYSIFKKMDQIWNEPQQVVHGPLWSEHNSFNFPALKLTRVRGQHLSLINTAESALTAINSSVLRKLN